jgi:cobalt-zinc-cadmium efflux system protein
MPHAHAHAGEVTARRLSLSVAITLAFVVGEGLADYFANSLALLSDAAHNFADALALLFSLYALRMARKPQPVASGRCPSRLERSQRLLAHAW